MVKFALQIFIAMLIAFVLAMVMMTVSMRSPNQRNMMSPFECGFDPKNSARLPFSLRFFLLAVVFLIFDMEVALLLPLLFIVNKGAVIGIFTLIVFLVVLIAGLLHEWHEGSLNWT